MPHQNLTVGDQIEKHFDTDQIRTIAYETKFMVRTARKVHPIIYLKAFCANAAQNICGSTAHYAAQCSLMTNNLVSKQAIALKIGPSFVQFLKKTCFN